MFHARRVLVFLVLFTSTLTLMIGCRVASPSSAELGITTSWVGSTKGSLSSTWGKPDEEYYAISGSKGDSITYWGKAGEVIADKSGTKSYTIPSDGYTRVFTFTLDKSGTIVSAQVGLRK